MTIMVGEECVEGEGSSPLFIPSPFPPLHISYGTGWENLCNHQDILSLVIISFILVTCMSDQLVIL